MHLFLAIPACENKPCSDPNEICRRSDYDGNHVCYCKGGYYRKNKTCISAGMSIFAFPEVLY